MQSIAQSTMAIAHGAPCDCGDIAGNEDDTSLAEAIAQAPTQYMMETEESASVQNVGLKSIDEIPQLAKAESGGSLATVSMPDTHNRLYQHQCQDVALYSAARGVPFENFNWRDAQTQHMVHRLEREGSLQHRCAYVDLQRSHQVWLPTEVKFHVLFGRERSGPATYRNAEAMELRREVKNFLWTMNKGGLCRAAKAIMQRHIQVALNVVEGKHGATYSKDIGGHFDNEEIHMDSQTEMPSQLSQEPFSFVRICDNNLDETLS